MRLALTLFRHVFQFNSSEVYDRQLDMFNSRSDVAKAKIP